MLKDCDLVGVVENDKPVDILKGLQKKNKDIHGVYRAKKPLGTSNAFKFGKNTGDVIVNPKDKKGAPIDQKIAHAKLFSNRSYSGYSWMKRMVTTRKDDDEVAKNRTSYIDAIDAYRKKSGRLIFDDGLTIYYRSDRIQLVGDNEHGTSFDVKSVPTSMSAPDQDSACDFFTWTFKSKRDVFAPVFQVTVAHLASGDDDGGAGKRTKTLTELIEQKSTHCIILADSNFSAHYVHDSKNMTKIANAGLLDVFEHSDGLETFKIRHAAGGQPKKFCDMMFDRIDRILVDPKYVTPVSGTIGDPRDYGFTTYPSENFRHLQNLRTNETIRNYLKATCLEENWVSGKEFSGTAAQWKKDFRLPSDLLAHVYPNEKAPSDHPPVSVTLMMKWHPGL